MRGRWRVKFQVEESWCRRVYFVFFFEARSGCRANWLFQPFGGGHGTPHSANCFRVQPPCGIRAFSISSSLGITNSLNQPYSRWLNFSLNLLIFASFARRLFPISFLRTFVMSSFRLRPHISLPCPNKL